jgi:hypothetical protein
MMMFEELRVLSVYVTLDHYLEHPQHTLVLETSG